MTKDQIQYLKINNMPYSSSLFFILHSNFKKYCATMKLPAYRDFGWEDSERLEENFANLKRSLQDD